MTTKKFIVSERVNNEWQNVAEYQIRALAVGYIVEAMSSDRNADPQDFKIQVEEVEVKTKTELLVEELVAKLKRYGDEWIVTQEENRAYISRTCGLWSSAVLMDIVEFMQQPEYADHGFHINREGMLVIYNPEED